MDDQNSCQNLPEFMKTQISVINKHLDEHKWLRQTEDKSEALNSFINDYGWLFREMYCTRICEKRINCNISKKLTEEGDLLKNKLQK